jgi:muramidase (phage lysozyme)
MRKRMMLVVLPLCVVAVAASVAFAAPSDAEHSGDAKLDNLHAERPTAAPTELPPPFGALVAAASLDSALNRYLAVTAYQRNLDLLALGDYLASLSAASSGANSPVYSSGASNGDFLACVRQRESGGNYSVYNAGGSGAAGAYQFLPGTWNSIAAAEGRSDLVGVDPAQASPADQDAMAAALYAQQGSAPWGGAC